MAVNLQYMNDVIVCRLDGSPLGSIPLRNTSVEDLYKRITKTLPDDLAYNRSTLGNDGLEIEIYELDSDFLNDILELAEHDVGHLYNEVYKGQKFKKRLFITIRELFFQKIVEYGLSYRDARSYHFLDMLTYSSAQKTDESGITLYSEPLPIKLSTLLGHRFDGNEYSFKETNSSYIVLKRSNLKFFTNVLRMMRYLDRKDYSLHIDYPQYFRILDDGTEFVKPYSLAELHRTHNSNRDCTYYSNHWFESEKNRNIHPNSIMAILSYLKYGMTSN